MNRIKIAIASDHGGFILKNNIYKYLLVKGYNIVDFGTNSSESCDYPVFAKKVCAAILNEEVHYGILICGTGLGMQMCANRFKGIRAACVSDTYSAKMSRLHNNSNVLTMGARVVGEGLAYDIVDVWLGTNYEGGRHEKRIKMLDE